MRRSYGMEWRALVLLACAAAPLSAQTGPAMPPSPAQASAVEPDTTGPITKPIVTLIAKDTYFINEFGADSIYLLVGTKRALVIDTGSGFFDLKALVAELTSLPYDVAITHGHPDHAGGAGQFDAVYIDPADVPMASGITYEGRKQYGHIMRTMTAAALGRPIGFPNVWGYDDSSVRRWDKLPAFKPLHDGMVFDLGSRKVTAYHMPNHTPGSTVFIDDRSRILFSGDAANGNVGANGAVSTALRGFLRLRAMRGKYYDRQYTGHVAYANSVNPIPPDLTVLDDLIEDYRSILRGNPKLTTIPNHLFPERSQTVAVYGRARVTFHADKLWEPGEAHVVP